MDQEKRSTNVSNFDADPVKRIAELCMAAPAISAAYLFGSAAAGKRRPSSDVDVAILIEEGAVDEFPLLAFISSVEKVCGCRADVVLLNRAGEVLKHQVRKSGRVIFEREPEKRKRFEVLGRKTYEDFLYLHKRYTKTVLYGGSYGQPSTS